MARILLIDDDPLLRDMLQTILAKLGHQVTEAADGREGLRFHAQGAHDLVITDIIMPNIEGIEVIVELLRRDPATPIIAMSGGGRASATDYLHIAERLGARHILLKPFSRDELVTAISVALSEHGTAD